MITSNTISRHGIRRVAGVLATVGLVAALSACNATLTGIAQPGEVDIRKLDVGSYPIEPVDIYEDYRPGFYAMDSVGAMRLADYVATAEDVDQRFTYAVDSSDFSAGAPDGLLGRGDAVETILKRNKMMFGFKSEGSDRPTSVLDFTWPEVSRTTPDATTVNLLVMQFPDADAAKRTAGELYDADFEANKDKNQPLALPKYQDARAHWRPGGTASRAFLAHGLYVAAVVLTVPKADPATLTSLTEAAYSTQVPMLDQLKPLTDEEALHLPWDQDHILSRTLNPNELNKPGLGSTPAILGRRGILQFMPNRTQARKTFEAIGADRFAMTDAALLARGKDEASAKKAVTEPLTIAPVGKPADAPPNVPDSVCMENSTAGQASRTKAKRFTCIVAYRQYVSYLSADQLLDAHQRTAAQYALLANSQWQP
ncbi:hypothetical protein BJY24_001671 [Nocardia transvalensis]|uniref:Uncharacterized protein n=1 Tax=Nocardia transvalensis TaxID=37333 RepID=A0A7W9PB28_9NOCA|nr:hypothetical protein [Nocardia transvalensis]MBB5912804.1 hypothetical protein [Nocardia transvalensis]